MRKLIQKTTKLNKQALLNAVDLQIYVTLTKNELIPFRYRTKAYLLLNKEIQKGYLTRVTTFCHATQRGRGSYRVFNMSRSVLKDAVNAGLLKGVVNSSW